MKANKFICLSLFLILAVLALIKPIPARADAIRPDDSPVQAYCDADGNDCLAVLDQKQIEPYFELHDVEHYAYMDLYAADTELIPVILEARNRIIFTKSWVDDETNGWVSDEDGNVIEVLPHFHEVFPADWDVPCFPS